MDLRAADFFSRLLLEEMASEQELFLAFFLGVSKNNGTRKSAILIGFSIINHPFWGTTTFGNTLLEIAKKKKGLITSFFLDWKHTSVLRG